MPADIITDHEAQQHAEVRKPLAWPIYSTFTHCSGPCNQGRSVCLTPEACQTGQAAEDDEYTRPPMTRTDALLAGFLVVAAWGLVALVARAMGWTS
jgi:hypothetical protein